MITALYGIMPKIHDSAFVSEFAYVIGDVEIGPGSSIWPGTVIRADMGAIKIGKFTCIQDNSVVHGDSDVLIGTVVDFPFGSSSSKKKLLESQSCLSLGADELDCVVDYNAFKRGELKKFSQDIRVITDFAKYNNTVIKWIIETDALSRSQIKGISHFIFDMSVYFHE